jgi:hypothetical protein
MSKAKEALTLYDSRISQRIPFTLERDGHSYPLAHILGPLNADRYFEFELAVEQMSSKFKKLTVGIYEPKHSLWLDLVESREGYTERSDWKEKTHQADCLGAVNALLHTQVLDDSDVETPGKKSKLFDEDALIAIHFQAMQSGVLMSLSHSFRPETQSELDEYFAIESNAPMPNTLASAEKMSRAEKLHNLGSRLLKDRTGYADGSDVPPWHLATTTESLFLRQLARMGKSLKP